jgi:hypothetical protein
MRREEVRITHGADEKGKDIVFYGPSGLLERALFACVVKNKRIVGSIGSGTSAKEVLHQAEQAFTEPFVNPNNGQLERVKGVYVMSPHECPQSAVESIREALNRLGCVEFFCGARLMGLFADHWKDFLLFESNVLVSYLSALKLSLNRDTHLVELFIRRSLLSDLPPEFQQMYVDQTFSHALYRWSLAGVLESGLSLPTHAVRQVDILGYQRNLKQLFSVIEYIRLGHPPSPSAFDWPAAQEGIREVAKTLDSDWKRAYEQAVAEARREFANITNEEGRRRTREQQGLRGLKMDARRGGPSLPSERKIAIDLIPSEATRRYQSVVESACHSVKELLGGLMSSIRDRLALGCGDSVRLTDHATLANGFLLGLVEAVPGSVKVEDTQEAGRLIYDRGFMANAGPLALVVGPAGSGKTSFCKSQALRDADRLLENRDSRLPVFIPLHRFASCVPPSPDEAFFAPLELRLLMKELPDVPIRLYLDGLDEIPDASKQQMIVDHARAALASNANIGVIITARNHISGPWLSDIPRVQIDELTGNQQRRLAANWLTSDSAVDRFFADLDRVLPLKKLMGVPFLATLITAVYKRQGTLPPNRVSLYGLFVELLCGGWDAIKGVHRRGDFGVHDKHLVLMRLAMQNHLARRRDATDADLRIAIKGSLSALTDCWEDLRDELIQDGLLVSTGAGLRFSHLSFQEYLAAEGLSEHTGERAKQALKEYFAGDNWWKEVLTFFVARQGNPTDTEAWLVQRARQCYRTMPSTTVLSGELDDRLNYLRHTLEESFPLFTSSYPPDGVVLKVTHKRRGGEVYVEEVRRHLSGAIADCRSTAPKAQSISPPSAVATGSRED